MARKNSVRTQDFISERVHKTKKSAQEGGDCSIRIYIEKNSSGFTLKKIMVTEVYSEGVHPCIFANSVCLIPTLPNGYPTAQSHDREVSHVPEQAVLTDMTSMRLALM